MEEFTVNQMVKHARKAGIERLVGEYLPTSKNAMVKDLYAQMGFKAENGKWELNLAAREDFKVFICPK
jgi:predicted enzyme involved in methoxymalonyl-ACP biosynthesis